MSWLPPTSDLHWWTARDLTSAIRARELSAREVVSWHLDRIAAVNPLVNALVTLRAEAALGEAEAADRRAAQAGEDLGPLHGLPIAIKDLHDTAGIRTTYGSRAFADHIPEVDSLIVARLRAAGAIIVGKTNTPEFGAGSHTFNEVFGATRNPWSLERSAGGSSGGAGAALAAGMVPLADGSDYGGSIRNPASFNSVVGLRPTPGLVPGGGEDDVWDTAGVLGPMARTVGDLALMLTAITEPHAHYPLAHGDPGSFRGEIRGDLAGLRVAWCPDLGGLPIEPEVMAVLDDAQRRFIDLGCEVEDLALDLSGADEAFETLRAIGFVRAFEPMLPTLRQTVKETIAWNVERGLELDGPAVARALAARSAIFVTVADVMERFDVLVAPAAQVVPFPIEREYPERIAGVEMPNYLGWMRVCSRITVSSHPVAAVPAGFTGDGLPVGLQLVGRHRGDRRLLEHAGAWERASGLTSRHPLLETSQGRTATVHGR
ncbi:MAG TPA: amidase [Solirubrobacteraceae bacterium]|nr:amidase [Solirubrobacteraceae bacterium]